MKTPLSIIADTIRYSFYTLGFLSLTFVAALLLNVVAYHPLWGSVLTIKIFISYAIIAAFLAAIGHYRTSIAYRHYRSSPSNS